MSAIGKSDKSALQLEISLLATLIENVTNTLSTVEDFYTGRPEADIPPENMWLEKLVDTSANGIDKALTNIVPRLARNDRHTYPKKALGRVQKAVTSIFDKLTILTAGNEHFRDGRLRDTSSHIMKFINYLKGEMPVYGDTPHDVCINEYVEKLRSYFELDAKAFYMLTVDRIATKKLSADIGMRPLRAQKSRPRLGIGGRGPKTEFMKQQVSALTHHLKKRSFKPTEGNIYAQALQCWLLNREEWDAARHARGQNKGYSSSKTLAAAWLNKKDNNRLS